MGEDGKEISAKQLMLERLESAAKAALEAKKAYGQAQAQLMMETAFQQGLIVSRGKSKIDGIKVEYNGNPVTLQILDRKIGSKPDDEDNIRFIIVDNDEHLTHLADVSMSKKGTTGWQAHEVSDVELDSDRGGHGSKGWSKASGLENPDKSLLGEFGLAERVLKVMQTVDTLYRSLSLK